MLWCWWDILILPALASSMGMSVQPQSKCKRRESIIMAAAEPGVGSAPHSPPPQKDEDGKELGMSTVWVSRQESAGSGAGDARGAPEALPKDRAVNCYLSNQAVSRLPGVKQRWWKVSCCQSEKWHRRGPFLLGSFCWECE